MERLYQEATAARVPSLETATAQPPLPVGSVATTLGGSPAMMVTPLPLGGFSVPPSDTKRLRRSGDVSPEQGTPLSISVLFTSIFGALPLPMVARGGRAITVAV